MAALSMGAFGAYKQAYSRYLQELEQKEKEIQEGNDGSEPPEVETVWITKRYIPTDLRLTAPVPRHKLLVPKQLPSAERHWIPSLDPPLRSFERGSSAIYASHPSTRCEEYSTLRQMLPSRGSFVSDSPPNWGTSFAFPPINYSRTPIRHPKINSPMTSGWSTLQWMPGISLTSATITPYPPAAISHRYVDDMHLTNRLFKLH